jgi:hypothetical protein
MRIRSNQQMSGEINEKFDLFMYERGYRIIVTDLSIDQTRIEEGASHDDDSACEYDLAETLDGLVNKCLFCGKEQPYIPEE